MDLKLRDKTCLVTGASRGIGRGIAKVLAAEGCRVAVVARRGPLLEELANEIVAAGGARPVIVAADLTADGAMERIRYRVLDAFGGGLDVLVNNAGSSRPVPWNATEEQWHEGSAQLRARAPDHEPVHSDDAGAALRPHHQHHGRRQPGVDVASVAKAALHNWAKGLSRSWRRTASRSIACRRAHQQRADSRTPASDGRTGAAFIDANIPVGYFGEPEDMAYLVAFLASPLARYITARSSTSTAVCIASRLRFCRRD